MKIWIIIDEQEHGPYARDEVFRLLSTGNVCTESIARIDGRDELLSLHSALNQGNGLFTFEQIQAQQLVSDSVAASPDLSESDDLNDSDELHGVCEVEDAGVESLSIEPPAWTGHSRRPLPIYISTAAGIILLISAIFFFVTRERPESSSNPVSSQENSVPPIKTTEVVHVQPEARNDLVQQNEDRQPRREDQLPTLAVKAGFELEQGKKTDSNVSTGTSMKPREEQIAPVIVDMPMPTGEAPADTKPAQTVLITPVVNPDTASLAPASTQPAAPAAPEAPPRSNSLSERELIDILDERFAAQPVSVFGTEESWTQERKSTFRGSFELETSLKWNPRVKVRYRIPQTLQGRPTPNADNMVMLCLWNGGATPPIMKPLEELLPKSAPGATISEKELARRTAEAVGNERKRVEENEDMHARMRPFSDGLGFTTFSLEIVTNKKEMGDKREGYFYAGPEWVAIVRRAQDEIIKRHRLTKKKLLLYGESQGGTFAARLAVNMPDHVAGVATQNSPEVTLPTARANTAWYLGVTRGDLGRQPNVELFQRLRTLGSACMYAITPPTYSQRGVGNLYHSVSPYGRRAALLFLEAVAKSQNSQGDNEPSRWPYLRDTNQPLLIRRNDRQTAEQIPSERREYIPSRECVRVLQSLPVSTQFLEFDDKGQSVCMVGVPPLGKPKGIIVISHRYSFRDAQQLLNNINFLAEQNYLVLAPRLRGSAETVVQRILSFVAAHKTFAGLPLSFIGVDRENETLWKVLLTHRDIKPAVHVPIEFEPGKLLDAATWPLGSRLDWPVLFLYDEKNFAKPKTADEARRTAEKLAGVKTFVASQKQKNLVAAVRFVPATMKTDEQGAQKEIETALEFIDASAAGKLRTQFK